MRAEEARDVGELARLTVQGGTRRIAELHQGIADRAFGAVGVAATPWKLAHDAIAALAYSGVRAGLGAGARAAGLVGSLAASGRSLDDLPRARVALAVLNGVHGDLIQRAAPALAVGMTIRCEGRSVAVQRDALAGAFPDATGRIAVFIHGLTETEGAWCYKAAEHHGRPSVTFGTQLRRDLGLTPVHLRYNTGLHVSDNGRSLHELLSVLVREWPVELQDMVLIGHSMGGLVARSALHRAGGGTPGAHPWTHLVRDTVTLGTPHLGAPLERGAHRLTHALTRLPETRPLARLLASRSAGIKDMRRGTVVEDDWRDRDLDAAEAAAHTHVPLHDGARHFVVLATLTQDPEHRAAHVLGDLLVPPRSASGDTGDDDRLAFPPDHIHRLGGLHHFDLLSHPRVYEQIRVWLTNRPEGPAPAAPPEDPA